MLAQLACFTFFKHREHLGMPLPEKHKVNVFHLTELAKGFFKYWLTVKAYWEP